jgi:hypothetical protein
VYSVAGEHPQIIRDAIQSSIKKEEEELSAYMVTTPALMGNFH